MAGKFVKQRAKIALELMKGRMVKRIVSSAETEDKGASASNGIEEAERPEVGLPKKKETNTLG